MSTRPETVTGARGAGDDTGDRGGAADYRRPPARTGPPPGVDVWLIPLDPAAGTRATVRAGSGPATDRSAGLDRAERGRARAFRDPSVARRYVAAHSAVRSVLGRYLGCPGTELRWATGPHGKPVFEGEHRDWHWSTSRSGAHALLAVSRTAPVGVDIERISVSARAVLPLAARFLPPEETALVARGPAPYDRRSAYHRLLSRKESCVKAVGGRFLEGLRLPVASTGAVTAAGGPRGELADTRMRLADLPAPAGWVATLATVGDAPMPLRLFAWPSPGLPLPALDFGGDDGTRTAAERTAVAR
ncbi:4'-phosphopantetheinyl transferase superfamily protein [Streptomyces sp. SM14]|uniref:4'-phosphopantetheinyl transferase family protein n=1 Tax=Streptomyces sp. SM14 TaxID=1736045 RepID=UPI000CD49D9E|nr:4'-phosphopantetheinyl transferase superfamily protein [Streptomyces sp. SM14]